MHQFCRIALAVSLSVTSISLFAFNEPSKEESLPVIAPESQHTFASKQITARFTRDHYIVVKVDDALSEQIFDRFIQQLDYSRNVFLASDINELEKYRDEFDTVIARGKLTAAYDIYNLNLTRRLQRYEYALSLLEGAGPVAEQSDSETEKSPFDFTKDEMYNYDREDANWPESEAELDELWRLKVKSDALNLTLAGKEWPKVKEILGKRYKYAIKRLKQSESEDVFQTLMNSFARVVEQGCACVAHPAVDIAMGPTRAVMATEIYDLSRSIWYLACQYRTGRTPCRS